MRGNVLGFHAGSNTGAITGEDGRRYMFAPIEWRGNAAPDPGQPVDFVPNGDQATQIYATEITAGASAGDTAKLIYILYLVSLAVGITTIVGVILAYVNRGNGPAWVESHYHYQIRTFWIGLVYGLIALITSFVAIGFFFAFFVLVWFVVRCAKGLKLVYRAQPIENTGTWLW